MIKQITLKRTWSRMPLWHKTKLMYSLIFQSIFLPSPLRLKEMVGASLSYQRRLFPQLILQKLNTIEKLGDFIQSILSLYFSCYQLNELNDVDMLTLVIQEMSKEFPTLLETLVHERDQWVFSFSCISYFDLMLSYYHYFYRCHLFTHLWVNGWIRINIFFTGSKCQIRKFKVKLS